MGDAPPPSEQAAGCLMVSGSRRRATCASLSKIRLISHRSYGLHTADALIALIYLCCTGITIDLPR